MSENITIEEHYVPRVLLRGFSPFYSIEETNRPKKIRCTWRYEIKSGKSNLVAISSVCKVKNLYEVTGYQGEYVLRNHLEKTFDCLESMFGEYRSKLEKKAFVDSNLRTRCFLNNIEKDFWVLFIALQILRRPDVIDCATELSTKVLDESLSENQARNVALKYCFPFWRKIDENSEEAKILFEIAAPMRDLGFVVLVDKNGRFVTSDKALFIVAKTEKGKPIDYERVLFPITSYLCIVLFRSKGKQRINRLMPSSENGAMEILQLLSLISNDIYSNHELSKSEIDAMHRTIDS